MAYFIAQVRASNLRGSAPRRGRVPTRLVCTTPFRSAQPLTSYLLLHASHPPRCPTTHAQHGHSSSAHISTQMHSVYVTQGLKVRRRSPASSACHLPEREQRRRRREDGGIVDWTAEFLPLHALAIATLSTLVHSSPARSRVRNLPTAPTFRCKSFFL